MHHGYVLDIDEIANTLATLPQVLRAQLAPHSDDALVARPAPGEWCVREVIGHLITCDRGAFRDRIEQIAAGASEVPAFSGAGALAAHEHFDQPISELLDELAAVRAESVAWLRTVDPTTLTRTAPYGEHGEFAAADFVLEWPFHDLDHIGQIADALQLRYLPHMTDTMRSALA